MAQVSPYRSLTALPNRPVVALAAAPFAAPAVKGPVARPVAGDVVVPGEKIRTALCMTSLGISPLVQASQTVGMLSRASFQNPLAARLGGLVVRSAEFLAHQPLINNPLTRGTLSAAGRLLPFVNAGILAFDGYAAYQTLNNPQASHKRKGFVLARLTANTLATVLCFIPGCGAVLSMAPAWASIGLDLYIKHMNAKGEA
jgi:hypothetical protein